MNKADKMVTVGYVTAEVANLALQCQAGWNI